MPHLERASFSGHETFPFRYTWLKKAVDHVGRDPEVFARDDAMVRLGVGKNMVHSIRHWSQVTGVVEPCDDIPNNRGRALRVTKLGAALLGDDGWDPYLEDPGTLWLLHWQLTNAPEDATTWFWVFNQLNRFEFTRDDLTEELLRLISQHQWSRVSESSVPSVPTSAETVPPRYLCTDGRRMDPDECPSHPEFQIESSPHRRASPSRVI